MPAQLLGLADASPILCRALHEFALVSDLRDRGRGLFRKPSLSLHPPRPPCKKNWQKSELFNYLTKRRFALIAGCAYCALHGQAY